MSKVHSLRSSSSIPPDVVLSVCGLRKKFCTNLKRSMMYGIKDLACNLVGNRQDATRLRNNEFWALSEVSFDVKKGEAIGIIGFNGSGKTTLLRVLTGILPPDAGTVAARGRVGGLIALGAGMHPHFTGRENIYLNGIILGMSRAEIDERMESIVSFAEIGDFMNAPLSTYSSGMRVRLGFAVAIHCQPDILLVDEVLSVGDYSFVNKSLRFLRTYREKAKALIYISHNLEQVRNLCPRVIVLHQGAVVYDGPVEQGIVRYQEMSRTTRRDWLVRSAQSEDDGFDGHHAIEADKIVLRDCMVVDGDGRQTAGIGMDERLCIASRFAVLKPIEPLFFTVGVLDEKKNVVIWVVSHDKAKFTTGHVDPGEYRLTVDIPKHHLMPGVYSPTIAIRNEATSEVYERLFLKSTFAVRSDGQTLERGLVRVGETWALARVGP